MCESHCQLEYGGRDDFRTLLSLSYVTLSLNDLGAVI